MSKDFRCDCGHAMSRHFVVGEYNPNGGQNLGCDTPGCGCEQRRIGGQNLNGPADPVSDVAAGAIAAHELLTSYLDAGFTREEAMSLVTAVTVEGIRAAR